MILKPSQVSDVDQLPIKSMVCFMIELENLFQCISEHLLSVGETVSTAEDVTSGFLQFSFSQMQEACRFFSGGMTAYTFDKKVDLLAIDKDEAKQHNCVSRQIAETMALEIASLYGTDWSIGITGYARPIEESQGRIFAFFAISYQGKIILSEKLDLHSRTKFVNAKLYYTEFILHCFKLELKKLHNSR
ncbi:nicotinamide-nucleotide amidohydrolase family protein [Chryseobacterium rhizoplanae]|uniref:CinA family protein n=1 Tax=Chryseobacterium rhizoplanae TaxID=1609531 RepID=UPI001CE26637|nr:nicotinamide-nucleotide amidohydrolase family protein [Chryseobacterium rhizoplanae]UCA61707.1 nicotinamide-nucleotide amidohydrolase family protein [Chryseobacterium rhizoplanae]